MNDLALFLPTALTVIDAVLLVIASLATSFLTAAFGIGGGFTLIALMALLPPAALIPIHGIVQLGSNAGARGNNGQRRMWRPVPICCWYNHRGGTWRYGGRSIATLVDKAGCGWVYFVCGVHHITANSTAIFLLAV